MIVSVLLILGGWQAAALEPCRNRLKVEGHLDLGELTNYLFVFADGSQQAVWRGKTGYYGDVALDSISATEQNVGGNAPPFEGTLTSNAPPGLWQSIVNNNAPNAIGVVDTSEVLKLETELNTVLDNIAHLPTTQGFGNLSASNLNGFNSENQKEDFFVMDITKGFEVSSKINVKGDANDIFVLRWDTDGNPLNGYQGKVHFKDCGAIVPNGGLMASNFVHVAGEIMASTGDVNCQVPAAPYPQGPRRGGKGTLELITGGQDWPAGGGFFTGYWLTTGDPVDGGTSLEDARFVGGWYTKAKSFWMEDVNGGGVHICPNEFNMVDFGVLRLEVSKSCQKWGPQFLLFTFLFLYCLLGTYCVYVDLSLIPFLKFVSMNKQTIVRAAQLLIMIHTLTAITCVFRAISCLRYAGWKNWEIPAIMSPGVGALLACGPIAILLFLFTRVTMDWASITKYAMDRKMQLNVRRLHMVLNCLMFGLFIALFLILIDWVTIPEGSPALEIIAGLMALTSLAAGLSFSYYAIVVVRTIEQSPANNEPKRPIKRTEKFPEIQSSEPAKPVPTMQERTIQRMKMGAVAVGFCFVVQAVLWLVSLLRVFNETQNQEDSSGVCIVWLLSGYFICELVSVSAVLRIYRLKLVTIMQGDKREGASEVTARGTGRTATNSSNPRSHPSNSGGMYVGSTSARMQSTGIHTASNSTTDNNRDSDGTNIQHDRASTTSQGTPISGTQMSSSGRTLVSRGLLLKPSVSYQGRHHDENKHTLLPDLLDDGSADYRDMHSHSVTGEPADFVDGLETEEEDDRYRLPYPTAEGEPGSPYLESPSQSQLDRHPEVAQAMKLWREKQALQQRQQEQSRSYASEPWRKEHATPAELESHPEVAAAMAHWREKQRKEREQGSGP